MHHTILVVDDDEQMRAVFEDLIRDAGYAVLTAGDCKAALDIVFRKQVDVVFADVFLPGAKGTDMLKELKKRRLNIPVVMITGVRDVDAAAEAVRLGAFDYIFKPVVRDRLLQSLSRAVQHKALLDEKAQLQIAKEVYVQTLNAVFEGVQDAVVVVDRNMKILMANQAAKNIFIFNENGEFTAAGTGSHPCTEIVRDTFASQRSVYGFRIEAYNKHGQQGTYLVNTALFFGGSEQPDGVVLIVRDITQITAIEEGLLNRSVFHRIVGTSKRMRDVYALIEEVADTKATVLITGETGTGKELAAEAIHRSGERAHMPLVKVNCAALNENLLESELFGHVRGAFTGAVRDKAGRFQKADGGSILLDEIGEVSPRIQAKLLRVLQEGTFERVGDSQTVSVDVKIIAATNKPLQHMVAAGSFRPDLYYRLNVINIHLPALVERKEDIPLLIEAFRKKYNKQFNRNIQEVSAEVMDIFMHYSWPGNVRQLEHAVEHAAIRCHNAVMTPAHIPEELKRELADCPYNNKGSDSDAVLHILTQTGWNIAKAARLLGISRPTLYKRIKQLDLAQ